LPLVLHDNSLVRRATRHRSHERARPPPSSDIGRTTAGARSAAACGVGFADEAAGTRLSCMGRPRQSAPQRRTAKASGRRWSRRVNETSNALDLSQGVFKLAAPRAIAASLKRSAERSKRRRATAYQSAMSMLNFYVNRGGRQLDARQKKRLERAKGEPRVLIGRAR